MICERYIDELLPGGREFEWDLGARTAFAWRTRTGELDVLLDVSLGNAFAVSDMKAVQLFGTEQTGDLVGRDTEVFCDLLRCVEFLGHRSGVWNALLPVEVVMGDDSPVGVAFMR